MSSLKCQRASITLSCRFIFTIHRFKNADIHIHIYRSSYGCDFTVDSIRPYLRHLLRQWVVAIHAWHSITRFKPRCNQSTFTLQQAFWQSRGRPFSNTLPSLRLRLGVVSVAAVCLHFVFFFFVFLFSLLIFFPIIFLRFSLSNNLKSMEFTSEYKIHRKFFHCIIRWVKVGWKAVWALISLQRQEVLHYY